MADILDVPMGGPRFTAEDLESIKNKHYRDSRGIGKEWWCWGCEQEWPCEVARLIEVMDEARAALARVEALAVHWDVNGAQFGEVIRNAIRGA